MANKPLIEIKNATVIKEDTTLLKNISLTLYRGEHIAVIGPNGAGKTSLIKLLTGEYRPIHKPDTVVKILGETRWDLFNLRRNFGVVGGDLQTTYRKDVTAEEAVLSGYYGSVGVYGYQKITGEMKKKSRKMLEEVGIGDLAEKYLSCMSAGEVRRVLIARALVHNPEMLILDEPTANLDVKATHDFLSTVRKTAERGHTIIMVTHHINEIIPEIKRVIMLKRGEIFFDGLKEEALTTKKVSGLFDAKIRVHRVGGYINITYW